MSPIHLNHTGGGGASISQFREIFAHVVPPSFWKGNARTVRDARTVVLGFLFFSKP